MGVEITIEDGLAEISLDDGKVNALSELRLTELRQSLRMARDANAIVMIKGRPGIFSAGFDMKTFALGEKPSRAMVTEGREIIVDILTHPRPVAIVCTGHAYPMGAFLLLAADMRIGVEGDFRIGLNETAIKIPVPDFALALARARLSPPAFSNIATARLYSPNEALIAGYLDFIAEEGDVTTLLDEKISTLRSLDLNAFRDSKARMNAPLIEAIRATKLPYIAF